MERFLKSAQRRAPLALTPLGLLTLAACGGGGGSSTSGSSSGGGTSVRGHAVKGPLGNALVFLDYDNDGVLDAGEPSARTAADGSYTLSSSNPNFSIVAITDGSTIDTASGAVLDGITLKASSGASVVTPATTLMDPPRPDKDAPLARSIEPEFPLEAAPVTNSNEPEAPAAASRSRSGRRSDAQAVPHAAHVRLLAVRGLGVQNTLR